MAYYKIQVGIPLYRPIEESNMKKFSLMFLSAMMFLSAFFVGAATPAAAKETRILAFDTMVGVPHALTGTQAAAAFRGVNAGGLAWQLSSAKGSLTTSGHLEIEVKGLVLAEGANVGTNPVASFGATVSCVTGDGSVQNIRTATFPATTGAAKDGGGNAEISADVALPHPCFAPIIFVTSPGGSWFAVTGN
jgi:hypothetical protein